MTHFDVFSPTCCPSGQIYAGSCADSRTSQIHQRLYLHRSGQIGFSDVHQSSLDYWYWWRTEALSPVRMANIPTGEPSQICSIKQSWWKFHVRVESPFHLWQMWKNGRTHKPPQQHINMTSVFISHPGQLIYSYHTASICQQHLNLPAFPMNSIL